MISRRGGYRLVVILGSAALAYLCVVVTLPNVIAARAPGLALGIRPQHASANAHQADARISQNPTHPPIAEVRAEAVAALRRDPTLASPARDLGLIAAMRGDQARADALFGYSETMSRRDIPTQLWLIERRVAANDVSGALSHYGIALQVAPETSAQLFPVLTSALGQNDLVRPIAELVARGTSWNSDFLYYVNAHATNLPNAARLYFYLRQFRAMPDRVQIFGLIARLLQAGDTDVAARVYTMLDPQWRRTDLQAQLDGGFDRQGDMPPFGWDYGPGVGWRGAGPAGARGQVLFLTSPDTGVDSPPVAGVRRLLLLSPGAYRLTGTVGRSEGSGAGSIRIELACAPTGAPSVINVRIPQRAGRIDGILRAAGCQQQLLSIFVERQSEVSDVTAWLDDLRLAPDRQGAAATTGG